VATSHTGTGEASVVYLPPSGNVSYEMPSEDETVATSTAERDAINARTANNRAVGKARRFIVAWMLTRMWTLTYADAEWDRAAVRADVNDFLQRLRKHLGEEFPALYVIERHPGGHGYHVHLALQARFIDKHVLQSLWGRGLVQYADGNKAIRKEKTKRGQARCLARYLTKYMTKAWAEEHHPGEHRYEVTQGFQVGRVRRVFSTLAQAVEWLTSLEQTRPVRHWHSRDAEDWHGPPCWVLGWD
jgi:hypothetical protein